MEVETGRSGKKFLVGVIETRGLIVERGKKASNIVLIFNLNKVRTKKFSKF